MMSKNVVLFFILVLSGITSVLAAQEAIVSAEKALIYADKNMTSPLGFITRGKRIRIGEIPRNRSQVYPVVISGKIAYIRAQDISTEEMALHANTVSTDRFQRLTYEEEGRSSVSLSYISYTSQIHMDQVNDELADKDVVTWRGAGLRGDVKAWDRWDFQILVNFLRVKESTESFNVLETGLGLSNRVFEKKRFLAKLEAQALVIPFANYAVSSDYRVNGYGFSFGTGINLTYHLSDNWGIEGYGGIHYIKLMGFSVPSPFSQIAPTFFGPRLSLGVNYRF